MNNETLNKYQKPILLFMKHLSMWALQGSIIIDVTAGTGTTGVCSLRSSYLVKLKSLNPTNFNFVFR
jgi:DNA modification methylase